MCAPFPYLGNGWTDGAEIWFMVRNQLAWHLKKVNGSTGARAHVRIPLPYLKNGWTNSAETWCVVRGPLAMLFTKNEEYPHERTVTVHTLSTSVRSQSFIA